MDFVDIIIGEKDIKYNLSKWSIANKNVLFITGHSGSGKSHLSRSLSESKECIFIEGDAFLWDGEDYNDETIECRELFFKHYPRHRNYMKKRIDIASLAFKNYFKDVINFIISEYSQRNSDRLIIFDNIFIADIEMYELVNDYPIIVKGTSALKSTWRALKRSSSSNKEFLGLIQTQLIDSFRVSLIHQEYIGPFKKALKQTVRESSIMAKKKSPDLLYLEELFTELKANQGGHNESTLRNIGSVLKRRYGFKEVSIDIIDNSDRDFFGMSIYPNESVIDLMVSELVDNRSRVDVIEQIWAKNDNWNIEIDSKLLYDTRLNANPAEMVSVLLHEIGHTVASNKIPARVHKVISYALMKAPMKIKKVFTWSKAKKIMGLPIIQACSTPNFHTGVHEETDADDFAVKEGYGENLESFMDKLLRAQGNRQMDFSEHDHEKEIEIMTQWAIINVSELQYRKTKLKDSINDEVRYNKSNFARRYLLEIRNIFFAEGTRTRYEELVEEQTLNKQLAIMENVLEGFRDWIGKGGDVKVIKQSDIDIIEIEMSRIENEDDRIYVLDLIYDKLDVVTLSLDLLKDEKQARRVKVSKVALENQRDRLNKLRMDVLKLNLSPVRYGTIIRYPSGYEG